MKLSVIIVNYNVKYFLEQALLSVRRASVEVLVEGRSRTDETLLRGRTRRNTTVNFAGAGEAGDLVDVMIERSTSTTLRGTTASAVPA